MPMSVSISDSTSRLQGVNMCHLGRGATYPAQPGPLQVLSRCSQDEVRQELQDKSQLHPLVLASDLSIILGPTGGGWRSPHVSSSPSLTGRPGPCIFPTRLTEQKMKKNAKEGQDSQTHLSLFVSCQKSSRITPNNTSASATY